MPLDPRISLAALVPQTEDYANQALKIGSLGEQVARANWFNERAKEQSNATNDAKVLANAYVVDPKTGQVNIDRNKLAAIRPDLLMKYDQEQATNQDLQVKRVREMQALKLQEEKFKTDLYNKRIKAGKDVDRAALQSYYGAKWQGADENAARQAGQQTYLQGLKQAHEQNIIPSHAQVAGQFDPVAFEQGVSMEDDDPKLQQWAASMDEGGGDPGQSGQFIPAVQRTTTEIPPAQAPQQPAAVPVPTPEQPQAPTPAVQGAAPIPAAGEDALAAAQPQGQPQQFGEPQFVQVAKKPPPAPGQTPEYWDQPYPGPQVPPGGKEPDWGYIYRWNKNVLDVKNPNAAMTLTDPHTGKQVVNEPLRQAKMTALTSGWQIWQDPKTNQLMRVNPATGQLLPFKSDTGGLEKVAPPVRAPTPFSQGQVVAISRASDDLRKIKPMFFEKNDSGAPDLTKLDRLTVLDAFNPLMDPKSENGIILRSTYDSALALRKNIEMGLRGAGAVSMEPMMQRRYGITVYDTPKTILNKLGRLQSFFDLAQKFLPKNTQDIVGAVQALPPDQKKQLTEDLGPTPKAGAPGAPAAEPAAPPGGWGPIERVK